MYEAVRVPSINLSLLSTTNSALLKILILNKHNNFVSVISVLFINSYIPILFIVYLLLQYLTVYSILFIVVVISRFLISYLNSKLYVFNYKEKSFYNY